MGPVAGPHDPPVRLVIGASLYSPARAFRLVLQGNGIAMLQYVETSNLPRGWPNKPLDPSNVSWVPVWGTSTVNTKAFRLDMQYDGNLVLYNVYEPVWASNTAGNEQAFLRLQDDGNLIIFNQAGKVIWASNTGRRNARCKRIKNTTVTGRAHNVPDDMLKKMTVGPVLPNINSRFILQPASWLALLSRTFTFELAPTQVTLGQRRI